MSRKQAVRQQIDAALEELTQVRIYLSRADSCGHIEAHLANTLDAKLANLNIAICHIADELEAAK